jgi:uncharacterized protein YbbK (DUF523 family)
MILVSACLAGVNCRYDAKSKERKEVLELIKKGKAIAVCPEQLGGLTTPRAASEIQGKKVFSIDGNDVTLNFKFGAEEALKIAKLYECNEAWLKSKSPMCGSGEVYDGSFQGQLIKGHGILSKLLIENNIKIKSID